MFTKLLFPNLHDASGSFGPERRHEASNFPNCQIFDPLNITENGEQHVPGGCSMARKSARKMVRGRFVLQVWTLEQKGRKQGPETVPKMSTSAWRVAGATRRALLPVFGPCRGGRSADLVASGGTVLSCSAKGRGEPRHWTRHTHAKNGRLS